MNFPLRDNSNNMIKSSVNLLFLLTLLVSSSVRSESLQDLNELAQKVQLFAFEQLQLNYPTDRIQVESVQIDPALRLAACDNSLTLELHGNRIGASNVTVRVVCPSLWSIYTNTSVERWKPVLIASRHLPRRHIISAEDVELVEQEISSFNNSVIDRSELAIGMEVKRPLAEGTVIRGSHITAPTIIERGDHINVLAIGDGITVSATAIALSQGKRGEQVRLKNLKTQKVFKASATGPGQAVVKL